MRNGLDASAARVLTEPGVRFLELLSALIRDRFQLLLESLQFFEGRSDALNSFRLLDLSDRFYSF